MTVVYDKSEPFGLVTLNQGLTQHRKQTGGTLPTKMILGSVEWEQLRHMTYIGAPDDLFEDKSGNKRFKNYNLDLEIQVLDNQSCFELV